MTPVASATHSSTRREAPVYWRRCTSIASSTLSAASHPSDHPTLLGRTIAHEIGHLLLLATNLARDVRTDARALVAGGTAGE